MKTKLILLSLCLITILSMTGCYGDSYYPSYSNVQFLDETGTAYGISQVDNKPRVSAMQYTYDIAEGNVVGHVAWSKIGYTGTIVAGVESDIWSYGGTYIFPTAEMQMEVLSSDNTQDIGTVIFSGNSSGGSTTTLIDATKDFTAGTPVAVGDCILLDKSGAIPEWGYVSAIINATTLEIIEGFSNDGTGALRAYSIIDNSAHTNAHAVRIEYLDGDYVQHTEIIILNGTTVVPTVNTDIFRVNAFTVIASGSNHVALGSLTIRNLADTPVYSFISAGFSRARNIMYTVPDNKTLYVTSATFSYAYASNSTHYARIYTRANLDSLTGHLIDGLFYPFTEVVCSNNAVVREFEIPSRLPEHTDIKMTVLADFAGIADVTLRGWLEDN